MDASAVIEAMRACGHSDGEILAVIEKLSEKRALTGAERTRRWRERKSSQNVTSDGVTSHASQPSQNVTSDASREDYITTRAPALIPVGLSNDNPPIINPLVVPQPETTASRKASRAKPRTRIAENQIPSEADAKHATERGLSHSDFLTEWRRFVDHHRAKGSTMADWGAAWRTWLNNRDRFAQPRAGPHHDKGGFASMLVQSIEAQNARRQGSGDTQDFLAVSFNPVSSGERKTGNDGGLSGGLRRPDG